MQKNVNRISIELSSNLRDNMFILWKLKSLHLLHDRLVIILIFFNLQIQYHFAYAPAQLKAYT